MRYLAKTRKGRPPRFKTRAGDATRRDVPGGHEFQYPFSQVSYKNLPNGDIALVGTVPVPPFDSVTISRVLGKMALELTYLAGDYTGRDARSDEFDRLRRYVRFGQPSRSLWSFAWRRTSSQEFCAHDLRTSWLIQFPEVEYLFPLDTDSLDPITKPCPTDWTIITKVGLIEQPDHEITVTLTRIPESGSSGS